MTVHGQRVCCLEEGRRPGPFRSDTFVGEKEEPSHLSVDG